MSETRPGSREASTNCGSAIAERMFSAAWPTDAPSVALLVVLVVGASLRAWRLGGVGYDGDEPFEIFVRQAVIEHGWPLLPSGQVSAYGGILLYPGAVATWLGGMSVFWNRLPFAVLGTITVLVVARSARRTGGAWAGVLAAALVAVDPGHVQWSASVKVYGAQTLLAALALDAWLRWTQHGDARSARTFALWATLTALVHPNAAFLVGGLGVAAAIARGPKWCLNWRLLAAYGAPAAALLGFLGLIRSMDTGMTDQLASAPPGAVALLKRLQAALASHGWHSTWHAAAFVAAAAGTAFSIRRLATGTQHGQCGAAQTTVLTFGAWLCTLALFVGLSRHLGAMYLLPASPLLAVGAATGVTVIAGRSRAWTIATCVAIGAVHAVATQHVWPEAMSRLVPIGRLYGRFASEVRAGEISLGGGAHAALYSEGRARDYLVYGANLGASSFLRDGRPFDRYLGNPVLGTVAEIAPVLKAAPRVWYFVADKELATGRVSHEVDTWLRSRMHLVEDAGGMRLYVTNE